MNGVSLGAAFLAGVLSFLSPCILPLIPGYICFLSGLSLKELQESSERKKIIKKAVFSSIFFVTGFSVVFVSLGASASLAGKFLSSHLKVFSRISGILVMILGLHLLGVFKISWLNVDKRLRIEHHIGGLFGAFLVGLAFAFGWTPCFGPILVGILTLAATQKTLFKGVVLLAVYSLGLGIPFIITGFSIGLFMRFFKAYQRFIRTGEIIAGLVLIIVGLFIFTNSLTTLIEFVPRFFYHFAK